MKPSHDYLGLPVRRHGFNDTVCLALFSADKVLSYKNPPCCLAEAPEEWSTAIGHTQPHHHRHMSVLGTRYSGSGSRRGTGPAFPFGWLEQRHPPSLQLGLLQLSGYWNRKTTDHSNFPRKKTQVAKWLQCLHPPHLYPNMSKLVFPCLSVQHLAAAPRFPPALENLLSSCRTLGKSPPFLSGKVHSLGTCQPGAASCPPGVPWPQRAAGSFQFDFIPTPGNYWGFLPYNQIIERVSWLVVVFFIMHTHSPQKNMSVWENSSHITLHKCNLVSKVLILSSKIPIFYFLYLSSSLWTDYRMQND